MENSTKNFAVRLAAQRNALGYTQKELSDLTGVSLRTIQNWESLDHEKSTEPRGKDLRKLCEVLRVPISFLTAGEESVATIATLQETHSALREAPESFGVERQFKFTTTSREAAEIIDYFFEFMNRTGDVPERLRLVVADLRKTFPLERWEGKRSEAHKELTKAAEVLREAARKKSEAEALGLVKLAEEEFDRENR